MKSERAPFRASVSYSAQECQLQLNRSTARGQLDATPALQPQAQVVLVLNLESKMYFYL